jgi:hypothetical protein
MQIFSASTIRKLKSVETRHRKQCNYQSLVTVFELKRNILSFFRSEIATMGWVADGFFGLDR